jgi:hypothetical protein
MQHEQPSRGFQFSLRIALLSTAGFAICFAIIGRNPLFAILLGQAAVLFIGWSVFFTLSRLPPPRSWLKRFLLLWAAAAITAIAITAFVAMVAFLAPSP